MKKSKNPKKPITYLAPSLKDVKRTIAKKDIKPGDEIKFQLTKGGPLHTITVISVSPIR